MDSVKHASTPQPFFQKTANFMLLPYIYITRARVTWGYGIVRKRKGKERERQSLERSLELLEPLEPLKPLEPIKPLLQARQKPR